MSFLIIGRHEHDSFLIREIEHEQQSEKEAWANSQKAEKIAERKRRTGETNNEEDTKKIKGKGRVEVTQ